jgi:hypothetical protein
MARRVDQAATLISGRDKRARLVRTASTTSLNDEALLAGVVGCRCKPMRLKAEHDRVDDPPRAMRLASGGHSMRQAIFLVIGSVLAPSMAGAAPTDATGAGTKCLPVVIVHDGKQVTTAGCVKLVGNTLSGFVGSETDATGTATIVVQPDAPVRK